MKSVKSKFLCLFVLGLCAFTISSCGKPRLFGKDQGVDPITKSYPVDTKAALKAAKESLALNGYALQSEDDAKGILETHWQPSTSDSHYVDFFNRRDMGTVGSYYKLIVKVSPKGQADSQVEISSLAKSIVTNLKSTGMEENKVFEKIADFTRKHNIEVTNVGLQ